ncbi:uncharacterized protein LOC131892237 [Tigriopus californicus]|uniref:uncharacterized protein LOC131892237 n=1 Tax=Tigriopus californicus TaxID=6832 RepID=UPI0027DA0979|nr:uncharacterized protein LOC131892237 [Tigriopus californicus]
MKMKVRLKFVTTSVSVPFHPQPSPSIGLDIFQPSQGHEGPLSFCPLDDNEVPRAGDLVALDAEFVTLTPEEKSSGRNGRLITVKAAVRLVGRVTCVRGWGPRRGVPFIDDHISCEEEISDYVSKYSGIFPGDLDPTQSSHHVFEEDLQEGAPSGGRWLHLCGTWAQKRFRHARDRCALGSSGGHGAPVPSAPLEVVVPQVPGVVLFGQAHPKRVPQFQRRCGCCVGIVPDLFGSGGPRNGEGHSSQSLRSG